MADGWEMEPCPCGRPELGRHEKPSALWLCRAGYLEKEIGYALSELEREGEAWAGRPWHSAGIQRLEKMIGAEAGIMADPYAPVASSNGHDRFEDERGVIQDLLGQVDAVTEISTRAGKIRGNHVHEQTTQWTYIVSGRMTFAWIEDDGVHTGTYGAGSMVIERAGVPHAWKAEEDTVVLVFTRGPRSGPAYETDTTRLDVPLLR